MAIQEKLKTDYRPDIYNLGKDVTITPRQHHWESQYTGVKVHPQYVPPMPEQINK
jgi:hypothetical protein